MAIYPNPAQNTAYTGVVGKTHTNLVVSEDRAPAEVFTVSKTNKAEPFIYEYGPEGNQTVLIAKGKIVEAVGEEVNRATRNLETAIRVAEEDSVTAIGVNHHNVYEQRRDAMEGNRATVIPRSYIEVPLFEHADADTAATTAAAMRFGAAYGTTGDLKSGDLVVAGKAGNFKKFVQGTHDERHIIGKVWSVNRQLPPAGLLNYYNGLVTNAEMEAYLQSVSNTPVSGDGEYPLGAPYQVGSWRKDFLKSLGANANTGIPFLTDGYFSSLEHITVQLDDTENVENVVGSKSTTITGKDVTVADDVIDASVFVKLKHKIAKRELDKIKVTYTANEEQVEMPKRDVHVDLKNNTIVLYLDGGVTATNVNIQVTASVNPIAGIPTEWDYPGSVGAVRILLRG